MLQLLKIISHFFKYIFNNNLCHYDTPTPVFLFWIIENASRREIEGGANEAHDHHSQTKKPTQPKGHPGFYKLTTLTSLSHHA